jgi:hypothetical protein
LNEFELTAPPLSIKLKKGDIIPSINRRRPQGRRSQNLSVFMLIHDLPSDLFAVVVGVAEHDLGSFGAFVIKL